MEESGYLVYVKILIDFIMKLLSYFKKDEDKK